MLPSSRLARRDQQDVARQGGTTQKNQTGYELQLHLLKLKKKFLTSASNATVQGDPLYEQLESYHSLLASTADNVTTQKLSAEVLNVLADSSPFTHTYLY